LQVHYDKIALPIRAYMSLENLLAMSRQHESLLNGVQSLVERVSESGKVCELLQECSSTDATDGAHKYSTTNSSSNKLDTSSHTDISFQESVADRTEAKGKDSACGKVQQKTGSGAKYPEVTFK